MKDEECKCICHTDSTVIHMFACCIQCPTCNKHILHEYYEAHREHCRPNVVSYSDVNTKHNTNDPRVRE